MASKTRGKGRSKGTGSIIKKKNRFYFRTRDANGEKYTLLRNSQGIPVTTRPDALKAAEALQPILSAKSHEDIAEYLLESRKHGGALLQVPLEQAWDEYLIQTTRPDSGEATLTKYKSCLGRFQSWVASNKPHITHLSQIDTDIVNEFFGALNTQGISGRTYNGYRQALRLIFKHLLPVLEIEANPIDHITNRSKDSVSRREFTEEQVEAIFKGFDTGFFYETEAEMLTTGRKRIRVAKKMEFKPMHADQLKVLLYLCCYTGCRGQDGCLMCWSNIDLKRNQISYVPRKTARKSGKAVGIPLHPALRQALEQALGWQDSNRQGQDYILPAIANRYQYNHGGIQKDVMKIIRCATELETKTDDVPGKRILAANLYSLHSFRHTFVSFCANAGVSLDIVAEIVGHGSPIMTKHYAHFSNEAKSAILEALPSEAITMAESTEEQDEQPSEAHEELHKMLKDLDAQEAQELLKLVQRKKKPKRPSEKISVKAGEKN
jgi:integrase